MSRENWSKVGPLPGSLYAEMVAEVLKEKQIPHYLSQSWFSGAYGIKGTNALGDDAFIFVPEEALEEVNEVLETMFPDAEETDNEEK
ncbi:MAG: hypothetical protein ACRBF0_12085 [Calditrichia bacterium]